MAVYWLVAIPACGLAMQTGGNALSVSLVYENECITCHASDIRLMDFIEALALEANLQFIFDEALDPKTRISLNVGCEPLNELVRKILKGRSYALVFNVTERDQPLIISYESYKSQTSGGDIYNNPDSQVNERVETKRDSVQQKMEDLRERIDSGESDREYDKWAKIRGAKYATHDEESDSDVPAKSRAIGQVAIRGNKKPYKSRGLAQVLSMFCLPFRDTLPFVQLAAGRQWWLIR